MRHVTMFAALLAALLPAAARSGEAAPAGVAVPASAAARGSSLCTPPPTAHDGSPRVSEHTLAGVPARVRVPARVTAPPILLWHGFGPPDSPAELEALLPLDEVPAVKVYLELPLSGARAPADPGEILTRQAEDLATGVFEPIVMGAADELPGVVDALRKSGCLAEGQAVDLFGFSAGGAAVLYALAERRVEVGRAVLLNASTGLGASVAAYERATGHSYRWTPRSRALAQASDGIARADDIARGPRPAALLLIHGGEDAMLPVDTVRALHDALSARHAAGSGAAPELVVLEGLPHAPKSPEDIARVRERVGAWFLGGPGSQL